MLMDIDVHAYICDHSSRLFLPTTCKTAKIFAKALGGKGVGRELKSLLKH